MMESALANQKSENSRRTRQSGPLGELFDHGVDALNTSLEVLIFAASQNMGQGWKTVATLFACEKSRSIRPPQTYLRRLNIFLAANLFCDTASLTFYVQTWDEYHTKTLTLGIVNGPVEGVLILVGVYALTGYMGGAHFWQQSMFQTLGVPLSKGIPLQIYNMTWCEWYLVQGTVVCFFNTVESSLNVIRVRRERGDRSRGALLGLLPFFAIWSLIIAYLYLQPTILHNHLVPFVLFAGVVNAYSVGQMITAHLVKLPFPYWNVLGVPIALGVLDSAGPLMLKHFGLGWPSALGTDVYQVAFVFLMLGLALGVYGSFVVDVIVTICDYLDIWCLTIKHPYHEEANGKVNKVH